MKKLLLLLPAGLLAAGCATTDSSDPRRPARLPSDPLAGAPDLPREVRNLARDATQACATGKFETAIATFHRSRDRVPAGPDYDPWRSEIDRRCSDCASHAARTFLDAASGWTIAGPVSELPRTLRHPRETEFVERARRWIDISLEVNPGNLAAAAQKVQADLALGDTYARPMQRFLEEARRALATHDYEAALLRVEEGLAYPLLPDEPASRRRDFEAMLAEVSALRARQLMDASEEAIAANDLLEASQLARLAGDVVARGRVGVGEEDATSLQLLDRRTELLDKLKAAGASVLPTSAESADPNLPGGLALPPELR